MIVVEMTMSLDGFVAGPGGDVGRLHQWIFGEPAGRDAEMVSLMFETTGAWVIGKRTFDQGQEPWGDEPPFKQPCFVPAHEVSAPLTKGATTYTFVNDGIKSAIEQARAAAGDKNVLVMGGADVAQQAVKAGLVDELRIHLVPVLLGDGIRLFDHLGAQVELERTSLDGGAEVTHLRFRVTGNLSPARRH